LDQYHSYSLQQIGGIYVPVGRLRMEYNPSGKSYWYNTRLNLSTYSNNIYNGPNRGYSHGTVSVQKRKVTDPVFTHVQNHYCDWSGSAGGFTLSIPNETISATLAPSTETTNTTTVSAKLYKTTGRLQAVNKLASVADALGNNWSFSYRPGSDASVYTRGDNAAFPARDLAPTMHLVHEYQAPTGISSSPSYTTTYSYHHLRTHVSARRSLGFERLVAHDSRTGLESVRVFDQGLSPDASGALFPSEIQLAGRIIETSTLDGVTVLARQSVDWNLLDSDQCAEIGGTPCLSRHPYSFVQVNESFELDGSPVSRVTTTRSSLDSYGNARSVQVLTENTASGGTLVEHILATDYTFAPDTDAWILSRVTREQQTATRLVPGETDAISGTTVEHEYVVDAVTNPFGLVSRSITFPSGGSADPVVRDQERTTDFEYDDRGNLVRSTASVRTPGVSDRSTTREYDPTTGLLATTTNALGHPVHTRIDDRLGIVTAVTSSNGHKLRTTYDTLGRPKRTIVPGAANSTFAYQQCSDDCPFEDAVLKTIKTTEGAAAVVSYFDSLGREIAGETTLQKQQVLAYKEFDIFGRVAVASRPFFEGDSAEETTTEYDHFGRPTSTMSPGGRETTYAYSPLYVAVTSPVPTLGEQRQTTASAFDSLGNIVRTDDAAGTSTYYVHDAANRVTKACPGASNASDCLDNPRTIEVTHDLAGRKIAQADPSLGSSQLAVDGFGQTYQFCSPTLADCSRGHTATFDELGRVLSRTDVEDGIDGDTWSWSYDGATNGIGQVDSVTGPYYEKTLEYDEHSRQKSISVALSELEELTQSVRYDDLGRIKRTEISGPSSPGHRTDYVYSGIGLVKSIRVDGSEVWHIGARDALGTVIESHLGNGTTVARSLNPTTRFLDAMSVTGPAGALLDFEYTHDNLGNIRSITDNVRSLSESFGYDSLNRLTRTEMAGHPARFHHYSAFGNPTCMDSSSDSVASDSDCYDSGGLTLTYPTTGQVDAVATIVQDPGTGLNVTGRRGYLDAAFAYDENGNQISKTGIQGNSDVNRDGVFGPDDSSILLECFNGESPDEDPDCELSDLNNDGKVGIGDINLARAWAQRSFGRTTIYNSFNKPSSMTAPDDSRFTTYLYGPDRELIRTDEEGTGSLQTTYHPFANFEIRETDSGTETRFILPVPGGTSIVVNTDDVGSSTFYAHGNHQGSVVMLTDAHGYVSNERAFDAFGRQRSFDLWEGRTPKSDLGATSTDLAFTGQKEEGNFYLYNYKARLYDPVIGRFPQPDPVVQSPYDLQNLNRYSYVRNNPVNMIDPTGNTYTFGSTGTYDGMTGWFTDDGHHFIQDIAPGVRNIYDANDRAHRVLGQTSSYIGGASAPGTRSRVVAGLGITPDPNPHIGATYTADGDPSQVHSFDPQQDCGSTCSFTQDVTHVVGVTEADAAKLDTLAEWIDSGLVEEVGFEAALVALDLFGGPAGGLFAGAVDFARDPGWLTLAAIPLAILPGGRMAANLARRARQLGNGADELVTVYRGVRPGHPGYENAQQGVAKARSRFLGHSDPAKHNAGNTNSKFVSVSTNKNVAKRFSGADGVIIEAQVPRASLIDSPDRYNEAEYLVKGVFRGTPTSP
jgi:RHS repeat-associated protein